VTFTEGERREGGEQSARDEQLRSDDSRGVLAPDLPVVHGLASPENCFAKKDFLSSYQKGVREPESAVSSSRPWSLIID